MARKPSEFNGCSGRGFLDGPAIVDAVIVSSEVRNLPHLELDMLGHFALAKIRKAVLAVASG